MSCVGVIYRGIVRVAISTGGTSPLFANRFGERLEASIAHEHGELANVLSAMRVVVRYHEESSEVWASNVRASLRSFLSAATGRRYNRCVLRMPLPHLRGGWLRFDRQIAEGAPSFPQQRGLKALVRLQFLGREVRPSRSPLDRRPLLQPNDTLVRRWKAAHEGYGKRSWGGAQQFSLA